jgi:acylphosphatase
LFTSETGRYGITGCNGRFVISNVSGSEMSENAALKVTVHGKVQGVYYRLSTQRKAAGLGLTGTVKNLRSGIAVEVVAEGDKVKLDEFVEYLKSGPPGARVDSLDMHWSEYTGSHSEFIILH